jgi:hypothetical protein
MAEMPLNPWKLTTIGLVLVGATALIATLVVGQRGDSLSEAPRVKSTEPKGSAVETHRNLQADINTCNQAAADQVGSKTTEILKDTGIGAVGGAGVGAAGGAIADGGSGAGKGAAIGGIVGAVGGALYGLNENKQHDERYRKAYASCMRDRGHKL